ncbi:MAG: CBS domain-containing protein [Candidatus Woesearchaeota archaeon]|jgi:signal-transduction protein with cAMP-binding, CBS, and nucleotidyltransferase domain|nr:CBS domain-containing protein [Candidatus Woesearchaeota archaeon]MDP7622698.1 CBS domain-containing protein [Candidatus Woesearchaeota archaeon]HJN57039.1 CBS domain-containing protein [Candidatus Woesearchaeota archaeon]|tara:strand:- start:2060 stop:2620 length:561 start_codon:yes stop_codon:yes gene_type:complete
MKTGYQVGDAMTMDPISVKSDITLLECAKVMSDKHVGSVVVKDNSSSIGILTEQDIVRNAVAKGVSMNSEKVKDFMETKLITIGPDDDIYDALVKMRDNNIRHLPVVEKDEMVGLLTIKDILKIEPQLFDLIVEKFELKEESRKLINKPILTEGICQTCGKYSEKVSDKEGIVVCGSCVEEEAKLI